MTGIFRQIISVHLAPTLLISHIITIYHPDLIFFTFVWSQISLKIGHYALYIFGVGKVTFKIFSNVNAPNKSLVSLNQPT